MRSCSVASSTGKRISILSLFTESLGRVSALARGARKSKKRFGGALEPFHTVRVEFDEPASGELFPLRDAALETTRLTLTSNLARMDAAGRALGWIRVATPARTAEPAVWRTLVELLDRLNDAVAVDQRQVLAEQGLLLLAAFGWALELERCVRCGKQCAPGRAAMIDADRGGLVCRACGGARLRMSGATRARVARGALLPEDVDAALGLVEQALRSHAGTP